MKVIIAGGRDFNKGGLMHQKLGTLFQGGMPTTVVHGTARGADTLGAQWASTWDLAIMPFPADWVNKGRGAGHIRNAEMADYADVLVAFWDGESKGTKGMIDVALKKGLEVHVYRYDGES